MNTLIKQSKNNNAFMILYNIFWDKEMLVFVLESQQSFMTLKFKMSRR